MPAVAVLGDEVQRIGFDWLYRWRHSTSSIVADTNTPNTTIARFTLMPAPIMNA